MSYVLDQSFLPERYFEKICQIPHGSHHEKALSDYLIAFAGARGLACRQYPNWNVIIYKPATAGYEDHAPVMLQAHMDMVCEKEAGCEHDFENDPLTLYVEDGSVRARGTTLGADDGVGVAYMLALLDDPSLVHPPLECVFTVQEETTMNGAAELNAEDITARRMIGLDDMGGTTSSVSSCGCLSLQASRTFAAADCGLNGYRITVSGLIGGHSGACIHLERGNAIKLAARVMHGIAKEGVVRIGVIDGGGKDNAIPVRCTVTFGSALEEESLRSTVHSIEQAFRSELEFSDPDIAVAVESAECAKAFSEPDSRQLIDFLYLLPNGLRHRSMKIEGLTTVSENLASVRTGEDGTVTLRCLARSEQDPPLDEMAEEYQVLSDVFGFSLELSDRNPGWKYQEHSPVRETLFKAYQEVTGQEMKMIAEHGGLETGYFSSLLPGIDIATCGPLCEGYHTPEERLDLASFRTIYEVLKQTLQAL